MSSKGNKTILLVEDEKTLLNLGRQTLEQMGYTVLATDSPNEAPSIAAEHPGEIQLLMTNVIMPEMNGLELANKLVSIHPSIRCLYVSGYTTDVFFPTVYWKRVFIFFKSPLQKKIWKICFKKFCPDHYIFSGIVVFIGIIVSCQFTTIF